MRTPGIHGPKMRITTWAVKYCLQLIGQSEGTQMRFHPKGGIEHRNYLSLKNVVSERQGISTAGGPGSGKEGREDMLSFVGVTRLAVKLLLQFAPNPSIPTS